MKWAWWWWGVEKIENDDIRRETQFITAQQNIKVGKYSQFPHCSFSHLCISLYHPSIHRSNPLCLYSAARIPRTSLHLDILFYCVHCVHISQCVIWFQTLCWYDNNDWLLFNFVFPFDERERNHWLALIALGPAKRAKWFVKLHIDTLLSQNLFTHSSNWVIIWNLGILFYQIYRLEMAKLKFGRFFTFKNILSVEI